MNEYDFVSHCADDLICYLLMFQLLPDGELALKKESFVKECFAKYQEQDFSDISFEYFRRSLIDLYHDKLIALYKLSV